MRWACLTLYFVFATHAHAVDSVQVGIVDWPIPHLGLSAPSLWLGNDPILGRMVCPPLTRLNLEKEVSEPLIFKSVEEASRGTSYVWSLTLRSGIFWWNGEEISAVDIQKFFEKELRNFLLEKGSEAWAKHSFKIVTEGSKILLEWATAPPFGPFVLNGVPLWRKRVSKNSEQFVFECVGRYIPKVTQEGILLQPNEKYANSRGTFLFQNGEQFAKHKTPEAVRFAMPNVLPKRPEERNPLQTVPCASHVYVPLASAVIWNLTKPWLQDAHVRKALASLFPRKTLLQAGASSWGSLSDSLIPENHPGFESLAQKSAPGVLKFAHPIRFSSVRDDVGLVEKVLLESLKNGGVEAEFVPLSRKEHDAFLTGLFLPWPEMDLFDRFHSEGRAVVSKNLPHLPELDRLLSSYRNSLTRQQPDFSLLRKINRLLVEWEFVSVLVHHKACMEFPDMVKKEAVNVKEKDPDWFINFLTQLRSAT